MVIRDNIYYTGYIDNNYALIGGGYSSNVMEESFDYWYVGHMFLDFYFKECHEIFKQVKHDTQTEILTEGVNDFFNNDYHLNGALHLLSEGPKDQHFCLNVCFNLPHDSSIGEMKQYDSDSSIYRMLYRNLSLYFPDNYVVKVDVAIPKLSKNFLFAQECQGSYDFVDTPEKLRENMTYYLQPVTCIDGFVGSLLRAMEVHNLDDNTIVIFALDHAIFRDEYGLGGKSLCYEICTYIPIIVYNPEFKKNKNRTNNQLVQSIDIAPTLLDYAVIEITFLFQAKSLRNIVDGDNKPICDYLFTENLWSTQSGNPQCKAIQNQEWKYICYYVNHNITASQEVAAAKIMGMPFFQILHNQHEPYIPTYRDFSERGIKGEEPVYEELNHLRNDPLETSDLAGESKYQKKLDQLFKVCKQEILKARGSEDLKVLRYTNDSQLEIIPE